MRVRATCSFVGVICMAKDEVREVSEELASDLIAAGYVTALETDKKITTKKAARRYENQ